MHSFSNALTLLKSQIKVGDYYRLYINKKDYNTTYNYIPKIDNLDKMDKFMETHKLLLGETENLNRPVTCKEIKTVIKTF